MTPVHRLTPKENFLEAIRFARPEYVPRAEEGLSWAFELAGNCRLENWTDGWGVRWECAMPDTSPFAIEHPLPCLDRLDDFRVPDPGDLVLEEEMAEGLRGVDRSERVVIGMLSYLLFERGAPVMGMDNFLTSFITHPDEAHAFLHAIAEYDRKVFDRYLELGVDGISFSEDLGTQRALFISPEMFREFFLPEYEFIFQNVLAEGKIVNFHSCGCVDAIAGDLARIGVTILNPAQARANDLTRMKADTVGRMAFWGGIDTAVLARGTPDDVRAEVARRMEVLKPGGGWVCSPDQSIPGVAEENYEALWSTAEALGQY